VAPTAGAVLFNGKPLSVIGPRARSREELGVQMVFQNPFESLNPRRKVGDQIADGMRKRGQSSRSSRNARVISLLERLGLPRAAVDAYPHQFSGGQRQRIAIARALGASPEYLVLDEPLASLDASAQAQLANLLQDLAATDGLGMLLISHDLSIVHHIADKVLVMYLGLVVEASPTRELWRAPLHPYTQALIKSAPNPDGNGVLPLSLPGEVGDPANAPSGCRFHTRCPHAFDRCTFDSPRLLPIATDRLVSCWLHVNTTAELPISTP
jgi:peptide/nickel transport system ATP-binding protein